MNSVNWPDVMAGFVVGTMPLIARQLYIFFKYIRQAGRRKFLGRFWTYHRSTMGTGKIEERQIEIRYSLLADRLTVSSVELSGDETVEHRLKYSGHGSSRQGMLRYFTLRSTDSHERLHWYVVDPFFDPFEMTTGLYIALDLRGLPASGPMLLSRKRVPVDNLERLLDNHVLRVEPLAT